MIHKKLVLFFCVSLALISFSCQKDDNTCTAVINVVRSTGGPAASARVELTSEYGQQSSSDLADYLKENTKITDGNGSASFTFPYPAILDIKVTHATFGEANDLIKLEPGQTVTKTVTLQ
jgi:hypothetical protein